MIADAISCWLLAIGNWLKWLDAACKLKLRRCIRIGASESQSESGRVGRQAPEGSAFAVAN